MKYCKYCGHEKHKPGECSHINVWYRIAVGVGVAAGVVFAAGVAADVVFAAGVAADVAAGVVAVVAGVVGVVAVAAADWYDTIIENGRCKCRNEAKKG